MTGTQPQRGAMRALLALAALMSTAPALAAPKSAPADPYAARIAAILKATPLIDGHNDWPEVLREREGERRWSRDLRAGLASAKTPYNTDIARLRAGMLGGQFWSVYVSASLPPLEQVKETLEQIDLVKQIVARYPETFAMARTAADVRRIHAAGRIASLIGVEGGGQIADSLSVLRSYAALGAGYLTLTHFKTTDWGDSATDAPQHHGLTPFGKAVVHELNRLGMLVDCSHVGTETMRVAIETSRAPVIFSHSGARAVADHPRNVPDDVLRLLKTHDGIVMVNFYDAYVSDAVRLWSADAAAAATRFARLHPEATADETAAAAASWRKEHPRPRATLDDVVAHIQHVADVAGYDHVGLGSDFDGVDNELPEGLGGVDRYPALLAALLKKGWSDAQVAGLAGGNVLRVMEKAEAVAAAMRGELPGTATIEALDDPGPRGK